MNPARFVLSRSKLLEQYKKIAGVSDIVSYSAKTNPDVAMVLEKETSCWFSVHTSGTSDAIRDKKRVIFFAQAWSSSEIGALLRQGIDKFVVDNRNDLDAFLSCLKTERISLFLRMRMKEHTVSTGKHFVFGMGADEINALVPQLRKNKNINKLGIHFHRKTQNIGEWRLKDDIEKILYKKTLDNIDFFNIGGGIPIDYYNSEASRNYAYIFSQLCHLREWLNTQGIKMIAEPGRFLAGPAIKLETTIKNIYGNTIIVNCSVYNAAMDTFIANVRLKLENEGKGKPYTIKGITPDSMDILRYKVMLENPKPGDKIVFLNAGAYNFSTDFCGLKKLETIVAD